MKKKILIISLIMVGIVLLIIGAVLLNKNNNTDLPLNEEEQVQQAVIKMETAGDLESIINSIYEKANLELASLATTVVEVIDSDSVSFFTGLQSNKNVDAVVVSEPMMSSQAYSLVLVKVKDGADIENMKQEMIDNIDTRKWICVEAEKVYVTNHSNLICLVMSSEEIAKSVYTEFKNLVDNKIGKELEKTTTVSELPEDILPEEEIEVEEEIKQEEKPVEVNPPKEDKPKEELPKEEEKKPLIKVDTSADLENIISRINANANLELASLATMVIETSDSEQVSYMTGLSSSSNVDLLAVSEPMMSSQAYSLVLVKAKDGADIENMKQEMLNNINTRKWICVEAEKVYVTNYENLICLIMSNEEAAGKVHNAFKNLVNGEVGKVLQKSTVQ